MSRLSHALLGLVGLLLATSACGQEYSTLLTAFSDGNLTGPYIQTGAPGTEFVNTYAANPENYT
jgi:hypothetical protein